MRPDRVDIWCRDLGIRGNARKLLILLADRGEVSQEEMIEYMYGDDPDGGPLYAEKCIRVTLSKLRAKLGGRADIRRKSKYRLTLNSVVGDE